MLRFLLLLLVLFLLVRAVIRFFVKRSLNQRQRDRSFGRYTGNGDSSSGVVEEVDFEVLETKSRKSENR